MPGIPALRTHAHVPPEVLQARERLYAAMKAIVKMPSLGLSEAQVEDFLGSADEVIADPKKWPRIIAFQRDAEAQVRGFQMDPRNPPPQDIDRAIHILEEFSYRALWELGDQPKFIAGIASGYVRRKLATDPNLRQALPMLYTTLRARLLGLNI